MRSFNQKGEGKGGLLFGLLFLFVVVYGAWKFIPVMVHVYAYEDRVQEECKYIRGRTLEQLEKDLVYHAQMEYLPVTEENIEINQIGKQLRVNVDYTVPITTPVKVFNWEQKIRYDAPRFD